MIEKSVKNIFLNGVIVYGAEQVDSAVEPYLALEDLEGNLIHRYSLGGTSIPVGYVVFMETDPTSIYGGTWVNCDSSVGYAWRRV